MSTLGAIDIKLIAVSLASAGIVAASSWILGTDGPVHQKTGLDLHFLARTLTFFGLLALLGRLAIVAQRVNLGQRFIGIASRLGMRRQEGNVRWPSHVFPVARRLLTDCGWAVLLVGFLGSMTQVAGAIADHPSWSDLDRMSPYLEVFGPLSSWALMFLTPFIAARAAAQIWPAVGQAVKLPWVRLLVLALSYVALAEKGLLLEASSFDASGILPWLTLTLVLSYCGSTLSNAARLASTRRLRILALVLFFLAEASWVSTFMGSLGALSSAASTLPIEQYGRTAETLDIHLENLRSLMQWAVILLVPFAAARAAGVVWPTVTKILGFPIRRLILLGIMYVAFADKGIVGVLLGFNMSQFFFVLTLALTLSYLSSVLRNIVAILESRGYGYLTITALKAGISLLIAAVPSMVVWVVLNHLPLVSAFLIDHNLSREFGETHLPHFAAVYDLRYPVAALVFATGLSLTLPHILKASQDISHKPLTAALGYSVVACLTWICGSSLSPLGHGYALFGAIAAFGIFTLALGELARYAIPSSNFALSGLGGWLSQSKVRGFVLGASISFYGLLLRPVVYEMLWFAALYEYLAVLVLLLMFLLISTNRARASVVVTGGAPPDWTNWSHHQQVFQTKADPRTESTSSYFRQFVEQGEWRPLWKYLFGLLYRSHAPIDMMIPICRTLRSASFSSPFWNTVTVTRNRLKSIREAALVESLNNAKRALDASPQRMPPVDKDTLRQTSGEFIDNGTAREVLALTLVWAYWQKRADLDQALELWFPLIGLQDPTPKWSDLPGTRSRIRLWNQRRRRKLVASAISHLFGNWSHSSLAVATPSTKAPIFREPNTHSDSGSPLGFLVPGQGIELFSENETTYFVRSSTGIEGFVSMEAMRRDPILPKDKGEQAK